MNHHLLLILHLLAASVWVGGHLFLSLSIIPKALREKKARILTDFEKAYGAIGMPALVLLVITGVWMAVQLGVGITSWFSFSSPIERLVSLKLLLLFTTVILAISAQKRVIPALRKGSASRLPEMAMHAFLVTLIGIVMLVLGTFARYGGV